MTLTPAAIAAAMRQQAESAGLSERTLPGGLFVKLIHHGDDLWLTLGRKGNGPEVEEREQWERAFRVPGESFGYRYFVGEFRFVQYEWKEGKNDQDQFTQAIE